MLSALLVPPFLGGFFLTIIIPLWYNSSTMKEQMHIYVEKEIKERLEQLAEKDGRSLNNLVNKVLREFMEGRKK